MANKLAYKLSTLITSATIKGGRIVLQPNNTTSFNIKAFRISKKNIMQVK